MRQFFMGLSLSAAFIIGCVASQVAPDLSEPPARAQSAPGTRAAWDYTCAKVHSSKELEKWANRLGAEGWEMAGAAGGMSGRGKGLGSSEKAHFVWCFKRQL